MNKQDALELGQVMVAYGNGKTVQYYNNGAEDWRDQSYPNFNPLMKWRIKPEPVTRPWSNSNEVPALPLQVRFKGSETNHRTAIVAANDTGIWLAGASILMTHADAFLELEQIDGRPCGITEAQP